MISETVHKVLLKNSRKTMVIDFLSLISYGATSKISFKVNT